MKVIPFEGFDNHPDQPHNTCGQAVIASVMRHTGRIPPSFGRATDTLTQRELLDSVMQHYGPHWPLRNMITHPKIIRRALNDAGIPHRVHSRSMDASADPLTSIHRALDNGSPVIGLLDVHALELGPRFTLHWAVIVGYDDTSIYLSSWGKVYRIPNRSLIDALSPWFLPRRYQNYHIVIGHDAK